MESLNIKSSGSSTFGFQKVPTEELEARVASLRHICQHLDPYGPMDLETKKTLEQFYIYDFSDPFKVTNELLMLLEDSIQELQHRAKQGQ